VAQLQQQLHDDESSFARIYCPSCQKGPIVGLIALVLATGLLWVTSGFAQNFTAFETGDELIDVCNVPTLDPRHFNDLCAGYIAGVSDVLNSQGTICTPKEVTLHQTVDVILNYVREHPEQRSMAAPVLTRAALGQAFPCN
jgi:Rap1a immunity proteins